MVHSPQQEDDIPQRLSVLALSSRFDGRQPPRPAGDAGLFQYSLCRVVLMVAYLDPVLRRPAYPFSTRSVESF